MVLHVIPVCLEEMVFVTSHSCRQALDCVWLEFLLFLPCCNLWTQQSRQSFLGTSQHCWANLCCQVCQPGARPLPAQLD